MILNIVICEGGDKMWKKVLSGLFIGVSILTVSSGVYSAPTSIPASALVPPTSIPASALLPPTNSIKTEQKTEQEIDKTKYQVTNPKKDDYSTEDRIVAINGKAPTGTSVSIEVYGTTDLTKKNFNLDKLPSNKDYIEVFSETIKSGNMGLFQKELNLVMGINKIIINYGIEEVSPEERIIYVYDKAPSLTDIRPTTAK